VNSALVFARLLAQHKVLFVKIASDTPQSSVSANDVNKKEEKRSRQKTVRVKAGISGHDLNIKISHICEWLQKGNRVSVFISKNNNNPEVGFA